MHVLAGVLLGLTVVARPGAAAPAPLAAPSRPDPALIPAAPSAALRAEPAVVGLHAHVPPDRPSAATLGEERAGAATVIEAGGLAVTVGYLVLEATRIAASLPDGRRVTARVVGHDFESGLALLALDPVGAPYATLPVGVSAPLAAGAPVAIVGAGDAEGPRGRAARVGAVRPFVASWEYILERALWITPHHPAFGGAALVDAGGALVGVVSLRVPEGHVAIPIDLLAPVREALVRAGRPARPARPWLGIRAVEIQGGVGVAGVSPVGPARAAGLRPGDVILRLDGERVGDLEAFYRRLWTRPVGGAVELGVYRDGRLEAVTVRPDDRYRLFRVRTP